MGCKAGREVTNLMRTHPVISIPCTPDPCKMRTETAHESGNRLTKLHGVSFNLEQLLSKQGCQSVVFACKTCSEACFLRPF